MCSINDMLVQLRNSRQSIAKQIDVLSEVLDKSNNVLLQIETENSKEPSNQENASLTSYKYGKETEHSLAKIIEMYQHLPQNQQDDNHASSSEQGFSDYLHQNCQNLHFLNSNVRKLLVVGEIMSKVIEKNQESKENCK